MIARVIEEPHIRPALTRCTTHMRQPY
jgi:hypothetical protein